MELGNGNAVKCIVFTYFQASLWGFEIGARNIPDYCVNFIPKISGKRIL